MTMTTMKPLSPKSVLSKIGRIGTTKSFRRSNNISTACVASSHDFSIHASEDDDHTTRALHSKLQAIQKDKSVVRLKFGDFVEHANPQQHFAEIKDLMLSDKRQWQCIKFHDTVPGSNYRRWLFKKGAVSRRMELLKREVGIPIVGFVTRLEIDMSEMNKQAILALLQSVQRDADITTLSFTGCICHEDVEDIVKAISALVAHNDDDDRVWEGIIFHPSYRGEGRADRHVWNNTIKKYTRYLEEMSIAYTVPVGIKVVDARQKQQQARIQAATTA